MRPGEKKVDVISNVARKVGKDGAVNDVSSKGGEILSVTCVFDATNLVQELLGHLFGEIFIPLPLQKGFDDVLLKLETKDRRHQKVVVLDSLLSAHQTINHPESDRFRVTRRAERREKEVTNPTSIPYAYPAA